MSSGRVEAVEPAHNHPTHIDLVFSAMESEEMNHPELEFRTLHVYVMYNIMPFLVRPGGWRSRLASTKIKIIS